MDSNDQNLQFLVVADSQEALERALKSISSKSGTSFLLQSYSTDEIGLGKISANNFDASRIFDLGRQYQVFVKEEIENQKIALLPANPTIIQEVIEMINSKHEWGKLKFIKSETFEEDIDHVYVERKDTGSLYDVFRLGYYYALERQKKYPDDSEIL